MRLVLSLLLLAACTGDTPDEAPAGPDGGAAAPAADAAPDDGADEAAVAAGCADGEREGFLDQAAHPDIAACAGGFAEPGLFDSVTPACARAAGDDGGVPDGAGCNVADLCVVGWHVCVGAAEVGARAPGGCGPATATPEAQVFFVTRQSGPGGATCGTGANDLFGCGSLGVAAADASCAPLDRFSNNLCAALPEPWSCGTDGAAEADLVSKPGAAAGGVLCCKDGPL